jgi:hypothetical protein
MAILIESRNKFLEQKMAKSVEGNLEIMHVFFSSYVEHFGWSGNKKT